MALYTALPQQNLVNRGSDRREANDRRQRNDAVEVDRRGGDRRIEADRRCYQCHGSVGGDALNFSSEASLLTAQPSFSQFDGQLAARTQYKSTLSSLLSANASAGASQGASAGARAGAALAGKPANATSTGATNTASANDWNQRQANYSKRAREINGVVNTKDDTLRNLKITQDYSKLSKEMREMLGPDSGANWPTFATWASRQAGETIRQEDLGTTAKVGKKALDALGPVSRFVPILAPAKAGSDMYDASSAQVAKGNRKVYQEIAPQFARFIETFKGDKAPDPEKLKKFQEGFKAGSVENGGQDGLKEAFNNYYKAMFEKDPDKKKELMFLANGQVGAHEQTRLQPEIQGALPYGSREFATSNMMRLGLPDGRGGVNSVSLGEDVPMFRGRTAPKELQQLQNTDAQNMVNKWDRNPNHVQGSGAKDWTNMNERMNYILDLFRSRHDDPALFQDPFTPNQTREILANRVPDLAA